MNLTKTLLPAAFIASGVAAIAAFTMLSGGAEKGESPFEAPPVRIATVHAETLPAVVRGNGVVEPSREVNIVAQVAGQITWQADEAIPGGRFNKGQTIARIDSRDYKIAVKVEESRVASAQSEFALEVGRGDVAVREWEMLGRDGVPNDLALRKPQLAATQANLLAAEASLDQAKLNLERTRLKAPFDAMLVSESIDIGQFVGNGTSVARIIGTERFWVKVSLPVEKLAGLRLPSGKLAGVPAMVSWSLESGGLVEREAVVRKLVGELDPNTRTAQVLIEVDKPFEQPILLPQAYVQVTIEGLPLEGVMAVPRTAVERGNEVWVVNAEGQLDHRKVKVVWRKADTLYIDEGLEDGERIVISPMSMPFDGMPVTILGEEA